MPKTIQVPNGAVGLVSVILERRVAEYDEDLEADCSRCTAWGSACTHHGDIAYLRDMVSGVITQLNS